MLALLAPGWGATPGLAQETHAAPDPVERVTLEEALERFAAQGLAIRIARADQHEAAERARQDAAWPNPTVATYHESLDRSAGTGAEDDYTETTTELAQSIVWPWRQGARGGAADARAREARARFRADSAEAGLDVVRVWLDAWEGERTLAAVAEATEVFRAADRAATARYGEGDLSGYDLRRLRVERTRYEAEMDAQRLALRSAQRQLATLIAPEAPGASIGAADAEIGLPPAVELDAAVAAARAGRPEIAAAGAEVAAAEADLRAARWERVPEPTLRAGWKEQADGFEGPVVGLALALPLFDRRSAAVEAARAALAAAEARRTLVARRVEDEVRAAVERHEALLARAALFEDRLLADTDDLLEIARVSYGAGEISLLELLDGADAWRDATATRSELQAELWESWHEVQRATGGMPVGAMMDQATTIIREGT